jgi:predicted nucleotidyltransferase
MILVGYPAIGKSSSPEWVDLESSCFQVYGQKPDNWEQMYVNVAETLDYQNLVIFLSSHKEVRNELQRRCIPYTVVYPSLKLKENWIDRLCDRMETTLSDKDYKAYNRALNYYEEDIEDLMQEENRIELDSMDYNLEELVLNLITSPIKSVCDNANTKLKSIN